MDSPKPPLFTRAFLLADTHGLHLTLQIQICRKRGWTISLPHYYRDAIAAGWPPDRALLRIEEALSDAGESREYIEKALDWLRTHRELPE